MSRDTWRRVWLSIGWVNSCLGRGGERLPPSVPMKGYTMLYGLYGYCVSCVSCAAIVVCLHEQKATVFGEEMSLPKIFRACGAQKKAKKIFAGLRPAPLRPPSRKSMTARPGPGRDPRRRPGRRLFSGKLFGSGCCRVFSNQHRWASAAKIASAMSDETSLTAVVLSPVLGSSSVLGKVL